MRKIQIETRQFAVPCPRVGSIEVNSGYGAPPLSGQEIHQKVQRERTREVEGYTSEVRFGYGFERAPYTFMVGGRADGIIPGSPVTIEEIKTSFDLEDLHQKLSKDPNHPYVWQLRTYGYIHYKQTGEVPLLRLHLVSSRNFKSLNLDVDLDVTGYEAWLELRLDELVVETKIREKLFKKRQKTAESLQFPFESPRLGQKELVDCISENLAEKNPLMVQAPTGLGKTIGVLYPSLKDALARGQKVVYVTPKNSQHQVAEEAIDKLQELGSKVRGLTLNAKSKMCLKSEVLCNPQYCEFAKDYYKKIYDNDLVNKLAKIKSLSARRLKGLGEEYQVCPFELGVEAIERADVVIGDYNYVFAPRGLLGRLSEPLIKQSEKPNLVIDEAHNLPSRAQDYFSPSLTVEQLQALEASLNSSDARFAKSGLSILREAIELIQSYSVGGPRRITIDPDPFVDLEKRIRDFTLKYLESDAEVQPQDPILKLNNTWTDFMAALEFSGPAFFQTYQKNYQGEMLKVTCCDASEHLKKTYKEFQNVVAFSATLKPFEYYQTLMGLLGEKTKTFEFRSPFPTENRKIMIIPQISTKLNDREMSAPRIADVIQRVVRLRPGNYIVLFPSFDFLFKTRTLLDLPEYQILQQGREMKPSLVKGYLEELRSGEKPTLLLGVQGGVFSEGVDYAGDMLIGAFVVGPALPTFDFEREQIRVYYENTYGKDKAFDYAYVYPAMAKAIQSAGRVIRSEKDQGVIVLMDPRFLQNSYSQTMPEGWFQESPQELVSQSILADIAQFWESRQERDNDL
ncbi:ATP-dependent DNA helicase [Bdellovibrio sp. HCB337]|uniref:ATP-dependent DNA helicase n=1 Tax=Bdellovibrio sp. HCB337 TaxID=3394358 RepID=UPI0039A4347C